MTKFPIIASLSLNKWVKDTDDQGQYPESLEQLKVIKKRWGDRAVNPEYDALGR